MNLVKLQIFKVIFTLYWISSTSAWGHKD